MKAKISALLGAGLVSLGLSAGPASAQDLDVVRVGLSAFQDVNSIYVGIDQGIFAEEGIELDIQNTDWPSANELLIGGHVDIATASDTDIMLQNANGIDTTLAFPVFYFAGGGLMYDPRIHTEWKPLAEIAETETDATAALTATLEQARGARVGVSAGGGEYAAFIEILRLADLEPSDYQIIDLGQEELPPALISGSIDIMISGIPQRLAVLKQGYETLMDQSAAPSTINHAGFSAKRSWIDANMDLAVRLERAIMRTLDFIENNPDESFPIIAERLRLAGTEISPEEIAGVWNVMEFFPNGKEWYQENVVSEDGRFYWRDRFETALDNMKTEGRVRALDVPLEDLNYALKLVPQI
jgi:NitT/TauT family transport system substrate-binding protein